MAEENSKNWKDPRPGFKWPVSVAHTIAAPAEQVWDVISMPGNLELTHPFCEKNPVSEWPGEASRDEIHYLSGWVYQRRFRRWIEGVGYDLEIGRSGGGTSFVSWRIVPQDNNSSILSITIYPHVLQHVPPVFRWLPHIFRLDPMLRKYLYSVEKGLEWYILSGEPVPRNQFGTHPWFSTP